MNDKSTRKPSYFSPANEDPKKDNQKKAGKQKARQARSIDLDNQNLRTISEDQDIFIKEISDMAETPQINHEQKSSFSFLSLALSSFIFLLTLAIGLWIDNLISDLFARTVWLGWLGLSMVVFLLTGLTGLIWREWRAITRLNSMEQFKIELSQLPENVTANTAQKYLQKLIFITSNHPETARGRQTLKDLKKEIIDGMDLIRLAETELLGPLDQKARRLILTSAKRVSVVTALSPRILIDTAYVLFEMVHLTKKLAELYGNRPGFFGTLKLLRHIIMHLSVTGAVSWGDSVIGQIVGQGMAAKISTKLGEGFINGIMTARFGTIAMEVSRPMPFQHLTRPNIRDFFQELNEFRRDKDKGNHDENHNQEPNV